MELLAYSINEGKNKLNMISPKSVVLKMAVLWALKVKICKNTSFKKWSLKIKKKYFKEIFGNIYEHVCTGETLDLTGIIVTSHRPI